MRKSIVLFTVFVLLLCTACGKNVKNEYSIQETISSIKTTQETSEIVDNNESVETSRSSGNEEPIDDVKQNANTDSKIVNDQTFRDYNLPETYDLTQFGEENIMIDEFVDWCKSSIKNFKIDDKYSDNTKFLSYIRSNPKLVIPHMTNKDFELQRATVVQDELGCCYFVWYLAEDHKRFRFAVYPISELLDYSGLKNYYYNAESVEREEDNGICKYGQYFVGVKKYKSKDLYSVYFLVDGFLVQLHLDYMEWTPEYFDYFDFETVSLKD